jgi:hypothetical protein
MGDVSKFSGAIKTYGAKFRADKTFTLILRLRHSVIKTGVRMMSLSYSRISLQEMAQKLQLDSAEDAEFITAKVRRAREARKSCTCQEPAWRSQNVQPSFILPLLFCSTTCLPSGHPRRRD